MLCSCATHSLSAVRFLPNEEGGVCDFRVFNVLILHFNFFSYYSYSWFPNLIKKKKDNNPKRELLRT